MSVYSNVTPEVMQKIISSTVKQNVVLDFVSAPLVSVPLPEICKYAEDTGELAFLRAPCRGNKIICHKVDGHFSFTKACNPDKCKFFEKG